MSVNQFDQIFDLIPYFTLCYKTSNKTSYPIASKSYNIELNFSIFTNVIRLREKTVIHTAQLSHYCKSKPTVRK